MTLPGPQPRAFAPGAADIDLSVVIPVYNEQEILPDLYNRLKLSLDALGLTYEVLLVDDGSRDESPRMIAEICARDKAFRAVHFSRNFGHQAAVTAGIDHASGKAVVVMDADLQDPPEVLARFVERWREGYEVVYGIRRKRKEGVLKRSAYFLFYRLLKEVTSVDIPLDAGDFALIDRRVADMLRALPERNRFVRGLRSWVGFRQVGVEYEREARSAGEVKYTFTKLMRLALDGMVSFSYVPLRLAVYLGLFVSGSSFLFALYIVWLKLSIGIDLKGWSSIVVIVLFLGGVQLLTIGFIGEYVSRIYDEVKQRPVYVVRERLGFEERG